jgi:hypothetical protein
MTKRTALLTKLIVNGHVNVAERRALGIVSRREVAEIVKSIVVRDGSFPLHSPNQAYEGAVLALVPSGAEIIWQRTYPWDPNKIAERRGKAFTEIDQAIQEFIDSEWGRGIDGIALTA